MPKKLIIVGAGGHAKSIIDLVESSDEYVLVGLVDSVRPKRDIFVDYPILGADSELKNILFKHPSEVFVAIGDNYQRSRVCNEISRTVPGVRFATLVHSTAYVSHRASIKPGAAILAGAIVNSGCSIGVGAIINTNAVVDHDGSIGDFASLAPSASLGGDVTVGERSSLGVGASVVHKVVIGNDVCVGAGAVVSKSLKQDSVVAFGVPCRVIRSRKVDEPYL